MKHKLLAAAGAVLAAVTLNAAGQDMVPTPGPTPPQSGTPVPTPGWTPAPTRPPDGAPSLRKGLPKTPGPMDPEFTPTPGGEPPPQRTPSPDSAPTLVTITPTPSPK